MWIGPDSLGENVDVESFGESTVSNGALELLLTLKQWTCIEG